MTTPSVAVVVLDTLREDAFSRYFEWIPGTRFANAYSTSHWTVPAHASLYTGKYPSELGVTGTSRSFDCPDPSVVERLREAGYTTRLWTANLQIEVWDGWHRGYERVRGPDRLHPDADDSVDWTAFLESTDRTGLARYLAAVDRAVRGPEDTVTSLRYGYELFGSDAAERGARWALARARGTAFGDEEFLLVNLTEAHTPHYPPEPYRTYEDRVDFHVGDGFAGAVEDPDRNRRAYDDSAAYLAAVYRDLFAELRASFDYVVTLSDHGELLGEHGMWNHGYGLYPELARVPLVVSGADVPDATESVVASLLDVPQTVAELAGVAFESRGQNLLSEPEPRDRLVEYHGFLPWHRDQFERKDVGEYFDRYDATLHGLATAEGYWYETHADGLRGAVGAPRSPGEAEAARLEERVAAVPTREVESGEDEISGRVREQLEDLGYA